MENLKSHIQRVLEREPVKIIISKPKSKDTEPKKITIVKIGENGGYFQAQTLVNNQAFHENMDKTALAGYIGQRLSDGFLRLNAFCEGSELCIAVSKKGKAAFSQFKTQTPVNENISHNKEKQYILKEGLAIKPLIDMGIFTKEGKIVRQMYDKYRQINRFIEVIDDVVKNNASGELNVVDFGCGKGYLTFLLYYYLVEVRKIKVRMTGLDLKDEVVRSCNKAAAKYGYASLSFTCCDIKDFVPDFPIDMVISLHACDTATDYALFNALRWGAKMIFAIPCCQHEINAQISSEEFSLITRYGVIREQISSSLTDAIRGNLLTCGGYRVQLLDIVSPVHTPKNIMIRAVKANVPAKEKQKAMDEVLAVTGAFDLEPSLLKLLRENKGEI